MSDLHEAIMLSIVQNVYFFSDNLLPALNIDQLCKVLERSDLVVEDEYKLLQLLMPRLEKLQNDEDHTSLMKILNLVCFTEMSGMQLNEVKRYKVMEPVKLKLNEATSTAVYFGKYKKAQLIVWVLDHTSILLCRM